MDRAEELFERLKKKGEAAIDDFIYDRQSEELFLDFKRAATKEADRRLHDDDRKNLAKAISGFGNSEGGVIVWGVDCRDKPDMGDVASMKFPLSNPKRFVSWLEGATSGCTLPPHPSVRHYCIESTDPTQGFVITFVPKSDLVPHRCLRPDGYYMRASSDFLPISHGVLAGLFGRPPRPSLFHNWAAELPSIIEAPFQNKYLHLINVLRLGNRGPGVARELYVNIEIWG